MMGTEVEFGEKVKQVREERGMTQQTLAEKLYVTRQAVSRWECGARHPDLLTAKKIARILDVTLDELLSGEELRENIEKEPVLAKPVENIVQTAMYAVAAMIYLLLCLFSVYGLLGPREGIAGTPAGGITLVTIASDLVRIAYFIAAMKGLILSVRNKLTAAATGIIMCVPYVFVAISFLASFAEMQIKSNGYIGIVGWFTGFALPFCFAACILLFFRQRKQRILFGLVEGICVLTIVYLVYGYMQRFTRFTDLGFVVTTVHMAGKIGMAALLGYQAYVWNRKMKAGYKRDRGYRIFTASPCGKTGDGS